MAERSPLQAALERAAAPGCPPHLGLMHLLMAASSEAEARAALNRACVDDASSTLREVAECWAGRPDAWATVRGVLAKAQHDAAPASPEDSIRQWSGIFDALAREKPEAGVALYALGDPGLLDRASREIVDALQDWACAGPGSSVLDLGCGIGRLSRVLAEGGAEVTGADVSAGMVEEARRRCADLDRVTFLQTSGHDLAGLVDGRFDLVLAVDVFPYLVQAGGNTAARHVAEAARVLRMGGRLVIANVSYRGDDALDAADLARWATEAGLQQEVPPSRPFRLWDGLVFRYRKP
ncbi:class I SAM-dependent methyltransferase [Alsobacter soli]|nr:class I SAM-dependent methyltransferase [Alsobacter soli]